ncbi:hypothetical protein [Hamadaea tsunoensis]|uniref:hypothetical protein n=1 Tax=Hamadaea tsunoensis TaxID=53368 RepID=UPI00041C495B|nr:hypothetical protein [Hamadaea tsunoensis]
MLETHAGRPFEEAGAALRATLFRLDAYLDERSLHAFALLIAVGLPIEVRWRRDPAVCAAVPPSGCAVAG